MRMHILSGGRLRIRRNVYFPGVPREESIDLPVSCVLLKHPQANVLFDTGCHPDTAVAPQARWGSLVRVMMPIFDPAESVIYQLSKAGLSADDVDVVVCSHFHPDHCGCNVFFKKATVYCHAKELELARSAEALAQAYLRTEWDHGNLIETIVAEHDLFGDGRLMLLPTPGHTPGTTCALVALDCDGAFLLASDAAPLRASLDTRTVPRNSWNAELAMAALEEIAHIERSGVTVLFGHDDSQWRSLRIGEEYYK